MTDDNRHGDDELADLLCQFEEALAGNTDGGDGDDSIAESDPALAGRLRVARRGLAALDRVRRRWNPSSRESEPGVHDEGDTGRDYETLPHEEKTIGRFRIKHELGRGGQAVVFLAYDPRLRRQVALKVPRAESLASGALRTRFLREAEAAARLSHPNIVSVFEVDEAGPIVLIASEYCAGPTLRQWSKQQGRGMPPGQAAAWTKQLAEAVGHAHSHGVLHRDIKPSNVLLVPGAEAAKDRSEAKAAEAWTPKLADFGMAKLVESGGGKADQTQTGTLIGTIPYMAPEQAEGRTRDMDVRTDIYGLGALLYELLTGRPPFQGESDADTLRLLLFTEVTAPSRIRHDVPRDLEAICLKCLMKDAPRRYATAQQLSDDLDRFLAGEPTEARPPRTIERLWMWGKRRPVAAATAAMLTLCLVAVLGVVVTYNTQLSAALEVADIERKRATKEAEASRQMLYSAEVRLAYDAWRNRNRDQTVELLEEHIPEEGETDLREFAWHYLWQQSHPNVRTLTGHEQEVFSVAFSPDGLLLATASKDGTARIWDVASGQTRFVLDGHTTEVTSVAFSPDGNRLATGSEDQTVRLWHTATGKCIGVLSGHQDHVLAVAFSPDGKWLASGSRDTSVRIWNAKSLDIETVIDSPIALVRAVDFSRHGELLVADEGGHLYRFDVASWEQSAEAAYSSEQFRSARFSHDLRWLAAAGNNEVVRILESAPDGLRRVGGLTNKHTEWIQSVAFSPRDNTLASAGKDGVIQLWNAGNEELMPRSLIGHVGRVWCVAWSPDGKWLASAGADHSVKIWSVDSVGYSPEQYPLTFTDPLCAEFTPDGKQLVVGSNDGRIRIWDPERRIVTRVSPSRGVGISALAVSPDGTRVVAASFDGATLLWEIATGEYRQLATSQPHERPLVAWSPRGNRIAITRSDRIVAVIDAESGEEQFRREQTFSVDAVLFAPYRDRLAVVSDRTRIWDLQSGLIACELTNGSCAAFSHDGRTLATGQGHIVELWNPDTGERRRRLIGPTSSTIKAIAFGPDDRTLALADRAGMSVNLWDVRTGQELTSFAVEAARTETVLFAPGGERLVAITQHKGQVEARLIQWSLDEESDELTRDRALRRHDDSPLAETNPSNPILTDRPQYVIAFEPAESASTSSIDAFRISQFTGESGATGALSSVVVRRVPRFGAAAEPFGTGGNTFDIEFVTIGNPGNLADDVSAKPDFAGSVAETYRIGKFEISEDMIDKANLETADTANPLNLTHDSRGAYKPATSISWFEAARFVNWLNTSSSSTPAYKFDGSGNFQLWQSGDAGYNPNNLYRNSLAKYFLPSVDEWYKAAYYDPGAGVYYDYPTGSNSVPDGIDFAGDTTFDAVFSDGGSNSQPNDITDVGLLSPYGTAGQGGNVLEWQETEFDLVNDSSSSDRGLRGGGWNSGFSSNLSASLRGGKFPAFEGGTTGFRVASVPNVGFRTVTRDPILTAASRAVILRLETLDGKALSTDQFRRLIRRVVVYRDTNHNGIAEPDREPQVAVVEQPTLEDGLLRIPISESETSTSEAEMRVDRHDRSPDIAYMMAAVNEWARSAGHVGGFPTFDVGETADASQLSVVVIASQYAKMTDVGPDDLSAAGSPPVSDAPTADDFYARLSHSVDAWAQAKGYTGGILVDTETDPLTGQPRYRVLVFFDRDVERQSFHMADLDYPAGYEALCRKVQQRATKLQYSAGFPVSVTGSDEIECILLGGDSARLTRIPAAKVE